MFRLPVSPTVVAQHEARHHQAAHHHRLNYSQFSASNATSCEVKPALLTLDTHPVSGLQAVPRSVSVVRYSHDVTESGDVLRYRRTTSWLWR